MGKILLSLPLALILVVIGYLNWGLYYHPHFITTSDTTYNGDLYGQLNFLQDRMHKGAAEDMQGVYPEGFVFMNALYSLAWAEFVAPLNHKSAMYQQGHDEMQWSYQHINTRGRQMFSPGLKIPYGAFYTGWSSYVLGKKLAIEQPGERDTAEINYFESRCTQIAYFISSEKNPYAESYYGAAWPGDMTLCIASLALHDKILPPRFALTIHKWTDEVKANLDANGLMPHAADAITGKPLQNARGSSQSLMLTFLKDIDPSFAQQQFDIYKRLFLTHLIGLPGIREYPEGTSGNGDADSGPVIWGVGGSASIVGVRAMAINGDNTTAIGLRNSIETFGMVTHNDGQKKFLFGALPMADAFIAWANSTEITPTQALNANWYWRSVFQLISLGITLLIIWCFRLIWERRSLNKT